SGCSWGPPSTSPGRPCSAPTSRPARETSAAEGETEPAPERTMGGGHRLHSTPRRCPVGQPQRREIADGGVLLYDPELLSRAEADALFPALKPRTARRQHQGPFGHPTPRLLGYHADPGVVYRYSGLTHQAVPWPDFLLGVRRRVEEVAGAVFNSLLLNYYRD